jgi:hypothetical protein
VTVRGLEVTNDGWSPVPLEEGDDSIAEVDRVRGFVLDRKEAAIIEVSHSLLTQAKSMSSVRRCC